MSSLITIFVLLAVLFAATDAFTLTKSRASWRSSLSMQVDPKDDNSRKTAMNILKNSAAAFFAFAQIANARPEGVNRPDLLPKEPNVAVIDLANFLSKGQEKKITSSIQELEKLTGYKMRILCQSYPQTPGLAVKDYWGVDDNTVVLVVDRGEGFNTKGIRTNIMNLNLGKNVDDALPNMFWMRLINKLGNQPYVKEVGEDTAIMNVVQAVTYCLEDKENICKDLPFNL